MNLKAGDRIGDYEVLGVLGAGGMGSVYKARNIISDRVEAIKLLLPNLAENQDLKDRFLREIKTSASLEHPNIAGLRTAFQSGDMLLMVMEYVEGNTLDARLKNGPLPIDEAVRYTVQVLDALEYAHSRGVVHRDIKPANVIVTPTGIAKLLDFGIAKASTDKQLTMTGTTLGSLYYMSPEQIRGEHVDARADLYSLGITLYELVTGKRPFGGDSGYAIMAEHLQKQPVPPVELDPNVPAGLNAVILRSLAKSAGDRYQDASDFRAALKSAPAHARSSEPTAQRAAPQAIPPTVPMAPLASAAAPSPASSPDPKATVPSQNKPAAPQAAPFRANPNTPEFEMQSVTQKKPRNNLALALVAIAAIFVFAAVALAIGASYYFGSSGTTTATGEAPGVLDRIAGFFSSKESAEPEAEPEAASRQGSGTDPASPLQATAPINLDDIAGTGGGTVSAESGNGVPGAGAGEAEASRTAIGTSRAATAARGVSAAAAVLATESVVAQTNPQSGAPTQTIQEESRQSAPQAPVAPRVDPRVMEETRDFFSKLGIRAGTVQESARKLSQEQSAMGVSLRADIRASIKRMEYLMDQAEASINSSDIEKAKTQMSGAEREIEKLEKFFGIY